jgi:hypothetical protein
MNLDWILTPLAQCVLLAAGLMSCLYLVLVTSQELHSLKRKCRLYQNWTETAIQRLEAQTGGFSDTVSEIECEQGRPSAALRRRMLQLARLGEPPEQIAAALGLRRPEVDLVLDFYRSASQLKAVAVEPARTRNNGHGRTALPYS